MSGDPRPTSRDLLPGMVLVWTGPERVPIDRTKVIKRRKDTDDGWWATDGSGLADYVWDGGNSWTTLDLLLVANALDAHDGDLRERLAVAVEGLTFTFPASPLINSFAHGIETAARLIRETP